MFVPSRPYHYSRYVCALLSRPGQLDKLPALLRQAERKLSSTEARLQSAMGRQLDGVGLGLGNLTRFAQFNSVNLSHRHSLYVFG